MYGRSSQYSNHWDSVSIVEWCRERLPAQHTEAHVMTYGFEDVPTQYSPIGAVNKAARNLLSELDESRWAETTSSYCKLAVTGRMSPLDPGLPVLFICRGFAGLVVKKVCMLNVQYA